MSSLALPLPGTPRGAAFGQIVLNEARLTWRRPVALVAGVGMILQGFPPAAPLLVLAGYALVFAFGAKRFFCWE